MSDDYLTEFPEMCLFIDSEGTCVQNAQNEGEFGIFSYLVPLFYLWANKIVIEKDGMLEILIGFYKPVSPDTGK